MARFRSSTSSSSGFIWHVLIALALLAATEWYLGLCLDPLERRGNEARPAEARPDPDTPANYFALRVESPEAFFAAIKPRLQPRVIVFVGDSQGAIVKGEGPAYPEFVARRLTGAQPPVSVVSLHAGGANAYEQGLLLLTMLRAGIVPSAVIWSQSIFSQRKNEIRQEYVPAYRALGLEIQTLAPGVILLGESPPTATGGTGQAVASPATRFLNGLSARWDAIVSRSATVRFARRTLWDKGEILRRSPLARLLPAGFLPGTARQFDPPASILLDAARFVGAVSGELTRRGACVVEFLAPINRAASPRPFTRTAEGLSYPALEMAAKGNGATFLDLLNAMPPERFGTYEDGTPDVFHLDGTAHAELAERFLAILKGEMPGCRAVSSGR